MSIVWWAVTTKKFVQIDDDNEEEEKKKKMKAWKIVQRYSLKKEREKLDRRKITMGMRGCWE